MSHVFSCSLTLTGSHVLQHQIEVTCSGVRAQIHGASCQWQHLSRQQWWSGWISLNNHPPDKAWLCCDFWFLTELSLPSKVLSVIKYPSDECLLQIKEPERILLSVTKTITSVPELENWTMPGDIVPFPSVLARRVSSHWTTTSTGWPLGKHRQWPAGLL